MSTEEALPIYVIDTCALVNIRDLHKNDAKVWALLFKAVDDGRLKTVRQVFDELERHFPDVYKKLKTHKRKMIISDADLYSPLVVAELQEIQRLHPRLYRRFMNGNPADPFLIAAAKASNYIVVTDEKSDGPKHKHKIPYVCLQRNVGVCDRIELLKAIGFHG